MCFMKKAINLGFLVCLISICVTNIVAIQESAEKSNVTINIDTGDCGDSADCSEGAVSSGSHSLPPPPTKTISVSGSGSVTVPPEYVSVSVGVTTQAKTANKALQDNNELATNATFAVGQLGVDDQDIATSSVSLQPVTTYNDDGSSDITGFRASNTLSVNIRPPQKGDLDTLVGEVLTALVEEGINTINSVDFRADNITESANIARTLAVENAFDTASVFAAAACYEIASVNKMTVNDYNTPQPVARDSYAAIGASPTISTPISSGDITVSSSINLIYNIRKFEHCDVPYAGQ